MATPLNVRLDPDQVAELTLLRDTHPKPYVRERAAAILKVASGWSARRVALHGLLRPRRPETVGGWIDRYLASGPVALEVASGRGRKTVATPRRSPDKDEERTARGRPALVAASPARPSDEGRWSA